jgi:hypothetical protein
VEKRGTFSLIALTNQPEDGQLIVEARPEEVDDLHLEVAVAARMEMGKGAGLLGSRIAHL